MSRDEHVLAVPTLHGEPDLVVVEAELRRALLAAAAAVARDHPFAHDAVSDVEIRHPVAELGHRPAPLVPRDEREAQRGPRGEGAVQDLEVRAADARGVAANEHLPPAEA